MLIDTHAHLTWDDFKPDLGEVVERAKKAGVTHVINIGADLESSSKAVKLECPGIKCYSTIGLHPHESEKNISVEELEKIYQAHSEKVVAVGECGLDYFFREIDSHVANAPRNDDLKMFNVNVIAIRQLAEKQSQVKQFQKQLFQAQIALAKKLNLPLIIHCRDSWDDIFVPELQGTVGVFHSFTGNSAQAQKILSLGYYLGFTCVVTYPKNKHLREIIKSTPLDKILTETDCPFLPPQNMRGKKNEPSNVVEAVKVIAQMKNISYEEVTRATFQNASELFKLA